MPEKHTFHLIGNAHLDPVWLWRWQEGFAEIKATFRSALDRMKEFSEFIFTCACASYYKWVEENAPEMFEEVKQRVKERRWIIAGGQWIQPDCNIPSGESFIRHSLYSQRYFLEKFGIMAKVGYNVDSFGHNGMLPQILKKSGMDYYVFMRPGSHEKELPGNLFWWEGPDGSRVMAFKIPYSYAFYFGDASGDKPVEIQKLNAEIRIANEQGTDFMFFYGVGNHGGGPTIANLNIIRELQRDVQEVELVHSSPDAYFKEQIKKNVLIPVVRGDLQHHASGCYSTHSETKASNRKAEHRLITAEKLSCIAETVVHLTYPKDRLQKAWQNVMFNHFHDIMGGCSIKEAYQDAREFFGEALNIGAEAINAALQRISWSIDTMKDEVIAVSKEKDWKSWEYQDWGAPLVVFNPLTWEVNTPIQVNRNLKSVTDNSGTVLQCQTVRASQTNGSQDKLDTLFLGKIPAMGYKVFWMYMNKELPVKDVAALLSADEAKLENKYVELEIDKHTGYIKRLYDKINKVEVLKGKGAVSVVIDEFDSDTWAHHIFEFRNEAGKFGDAQVRLVESGPVRARLRVTNRYNASVLQQDYILYNNKPDIEVRVKLDWREKHKLLKLSFPVNVENPEAIYEIPLGFIKRPINGTEEPGQQWLDVSGTASGIDGMKYGLALLNDCKYSFDVKDNDLRMTVVRSPIFADHFGERDDLCEYMDQGIQEFKYVLVPHKGHWSEAGVVKKAYELNVEPVQIIETYHKGNLPQKFESISVSEDNVIASVLKKSEAGDGYILRCYEACGRETDVSIELPLFGRKLDVKFGRCEIKTFFIPLNKHEPIVEKNLIEM